MAIKIAKQKRQRRNENEDSSVWSKSVVTYPELQPIVLNMFHHVYVENRIGRAGGPNIFRDLREDVVIKLNLRTGLQRRNRCFQLGKHRRRLDQRQGFRDALEQHLRKRTGTRSDLDQMLA